LALVVSPASRLDFSRVAVVGAAGRVMRARAP
jgi:hypothetical protein